MTQAMLSEKALELFVEPLSVFLAVSGATSPMAPDGRKDLQLPDSRAHLGHFILRIFGPV